MPVHTHFIIFELLFYNQQFNCSEVCMHLRDFICLYLCLHLGVFMCVIVCTRVIQKVSSNGLLKKNKNILQTLYIAI